MMRITEFQRKVYEATRQIPRGSVVTYGELARRIGCKSARAVGQALRKNPFAPEVPCHRVIAADGSLGGSSVRMRLWVNELDVEKAKPVVDKLMKITV